ncbi:BTAD domain-containing putative transcriptional regulator [Streptomyces sp. NPDC050095]|uniref:BTAD domain-containing putative transcriptional regulator n=1 Tax=unclassified Streptomyces TaxID=2593676 RepID=UPI0034381A3E
MTSSLRTRLRAASSAAGTALVTLLLLAGMPWVLWQAAGVPWPEQITSWQDFTDALMEPMSAPWMIDLLALCGWACWAAFACSVVREVLWYAVHLPHLLRDRNAHDAHLAEVSLKGTLAAMCVGTLVIALIGLCRPNPAAIQQPSEEGELRAQVAATAPLAPVAATFDTGTPTSAEDAGARTVEYVEYTVMPGDTLWDIADAYLGDALKWPRIYKLNKDRIQGDGERLTDPDLIRPGWRLAVPVPQAATPAAPSPKPARPTPPVRPAPPAASATPPAPAAPDADSGESEASGSRVQPARSAVSVIDAGLIGITTAAGLLAALRYLRIHRQRRRPDEATAGETLAPVVEQAVHAAREATLPRTPPDTEQLITRRTPPPPPQPADVVTIGTTADGDEVALTEVTAAGGLFWTGPGVEPAARALLCGALTAAERQRPGPPLTKAVLPQDLAERLLPGLPATFTALTQTADSAHALDLAEQHVIAHARHQQQDDTTISSGAGPLAAVTSSPDERNPGALLLLTRPEPAHAGRLAALAARSAPGTLIVITLGHPLPGAPSWNITADGTVHTSHPTTDLRGLRLFHLTAQAGQDVLAVLLDAHGQRPRLRVVPRSASVFLSPPQAVASADEEADDEVPPPPRASGPALASGEETITAPRPVRLQVLGPVTLYAGADPEPIATGLRPEVREFLALLAAHPRGLLLADIARDMRFGGDGEQAAREIKNLRRAIRRALRAATGITQAEFVLRQGELHKLNTALIETDLAEFDEALHKAAAAAQDSQRRAAWHRALQHYGGPFAQGNDYLWSDATREDLATKATEAAVRLADHAEHSGDERDAHRALDALEKILTHHPDRERPYQAAIRLHQAAHRPDAARQVYGRLERHLADLGLTPESATQALVAPRARPTRTP